MSFSSGRKPPIFLLHGWPDYVALWGDLATRYLVPRGYGAIIPDCLGFGDSSKPTSPEDFHSIGFTSDLRDMLDAESVKSSLVGMTGGRVSLIASTLIMLSAALGSSYSTLQQPRSLNGLLAWSSGLQRR
ncbi:hypothetical protein BBK36DRAFT_159760 [Trichoderma citrinoviride]|uniref:AB hydrolase-1 domain-containing protein n=1 Tax=Trichoderma citrinoviride TaxID=58853 RepID=A0A2T4BBH4_9HYPO|nr:hypothetical protein BBK36DRAFT_159760 [Trichoderma citrinoviride]PTB66638.1 hypothetical protein BBK36DRAFT_159760 [Trichoderma citrinoviride]